MSSDGGHSLRPSAVWHPGVSHRERSHVIRDRRDQLIRDIAATVARDSGAVRKRERRATLGPTWAVDHVSGFRQGLAR